MRRDLSMLTLEEFTSELSALMLKRTSRDGLSSAETARLREMKRALRPHAGPAGSPDERREFLRLEVEAEVLLRPERNAGSLCRAHCLEYGIGGLLVAPFPLLALEERFRIESLLLGDESLSLDVVALAVRRNGQQPARGAQLDSSVALRFIDFDAEVIGRIRTTFERLFEQAARFPGMTTRTAGREPAIPDIRRLVRICRVLTRLAGLGDGWSQRGPREAVCALLTANGRPLPVSRRVLVLLAWRLWTGICDLRSTEFWHLDHEAQGAVAELLHAERRGASEIDAWLDTQEQGAAGRHLSA